jgi:serine protease Do
VRYVRNGKAGSTTIKLMPSTKNGGPKQADESQSAKELSNLLGVKFRPISDDDRRRKRIPGSVRGVVVEQIETGSDALGKVPMGAVVTEVNFQPVSSPEQAIAAAEAAKRANKPVLLQVWGDGEVEYIAVRPR